MKGRLEHELQRQNNISVILKTLPEYVNDFYINISVSKEPTTCLEYIRKIKLFYEYIGKDLLEVVDTDIGKYFNEKKYVEDEFGNMVQSSSAYRQGIWAALNQFYMYLYNKGTIKINPTASIQRPKTTGYKEKTYLSMNDLNKILATVEKGFGTKRQRSRQKHFKERDMLVMMLLMNTGMRKTALSEINVEDIHINEHKLIVTDKRNKTQIYPITKELQEVINDWLYRREEILDGEDVDALFIGEQKKRLSERAIYEIVQRYSEAALGYKISPHKLRAAFISLYYEESGYDIEATRRAVGHASIQTTSLYITKENDSREEAANFMSKNLMSYKR